MSLENLSGHDCQHVMDEIFKDDVNPLQTAVFLTLLRSKTESPEELAAIISACKKTMQPISTSHKILDIVGTGGDGANTVNISTGSAILAASCGIKIAKHGNRAVSSLAGSADVLEALGINIHLSPEGITKSIDEINIGFCFSPNFHLAMNKLRALRKQLNIPTTFNIIGPLLNPANPQHYLLGVYDEKLLVPIATALKQTGTTRSFVIHSAGLDELSVVGPAKVIEVTPSGLNEFLLDPKTYGFETCSISDLQGGDAKKNAQLLLAAFSNQNKALSDTLILNTGVALYLYGLHTTLEEAFLHAKENIVTHKALALLKNWKEFSHDHR